MPQADTVLLPICVAIALIGVILAGLAWRRGRKGRVLQAAALAIVPFGLYLTGFLRVLWDAVVDIVKWAFRLVVSPTLWVGVSLIGLCVVLFVVGLLINKFGSGPKANQKQAVRAGNGAAGNGAATGSRRSGRVGRPVPSRRAGRASSRPSPIRRWTRSRPC